MDDPEKRRDWDARRPRHQSPEDLSTEGQDDGASGKQDDPDLSTSTVGRYPIHKLLGRGGMGDVFLAYDETLSRKIALKRIRPDRLLRRDARRRFEIEARITALLQHPSIVPVYEYTQQGEEAFYTMRPVEGITLRELLGRLRDDEPGVREEWPTARLVRLFLQAANALAFAHSRGVIHRDLKPSNVMIGPFEEVLVLDWGMAKVMVDPAEGVRHEALPELMADTASECLLGTPAYMAPEQLRQEPASASSDIFALGLILYELLALRPPWTAPSITKLLHAMKTPPEPPTRLQPGRGIPSDLAQVALKALEFDPAQRFPSVSSFSREVAHALEGRASWRLESASQDHERWRLADGKRSYEADCFVLRTRGPSPLFRYFCVQRFTDDVRVEFQFSIGKGTHELSVWLNAAQPRGEGIRAGYNLLVLPGKRKTLPLMRSGRVVAGARSPRYEPRRWYTCRVTREDDRFSLRIDGEGIYVYHDPIPLTGGFVGLTGRSSGVRLRNLGIYSRGTSATVSCLAVPDAFFNRGLYEEARAEYQRIAASHPGRTEGRLAGFRGGLCLLELARREEESEMCSLLLSEAEGAFTRLGSSDHTCLAALGRAMVAGMQRDSILERQALEAAVADHPDDPHLSTVHEWLLARLHALGPDQRLAMAELLPLATSHCMDDWGRRVVRDLVNDVRRAWEVPAFMTSRSRFKESEPISHAEAKLFFGFWAAHADLIAATIDGLVDSGLLRPHHLADAVFSLLELGQPQAARDLMGRVAPGRRDGVQALCWSAILAASGKPDEAERLLASTDPAPFDRVHNSARLWLARTWFDAGEPSRAIGSLRLLGPQDNFAREHQAWFYLQQGDAEQAEQQLSRFLERGDHDSGRNLSNFLYGVSLVMRQRENEARQVFGSLELAPWPRTWTLGSHYAVDRLGDGKLDAYLSGCFFWERANLENQARLLAQARGEHPSSLPSALTT